MGKHPILDDYEMMKGIFASSPNSSDITYCFKKMNEYCQYEINNMTHIALTSNSTAKGKNYIVFKNTLNSKQSRPVNIDLYEEGLQTDPQGNSKIDLLWDNILNNTISIQEAHDITSALYVIAMNYCCCTDLLEGMKKNAGDYFEKFIGHLYSRHLGICPTKQMNAVELDGESISLPTDYIFDFGGGKPKFHVPVKTSTRERVVEVWAQQRILDGAFGVGRFICLLTCIGETNLEKNLSVGVTCVPNQWMNYQLFVSQIKRAYYLDVPSKYYELNNRFPRIHVKEFGEFFHEVDQLFE